MKGFIGDGFAALIGIIWSIGIPINFIYFLYQDAQNNPDAGFLRWVAFVLVSAFSSGVWPAYWIMHWLFF
jgi:hypothetical protein